METPAVVLDRHVDVPPKTITVFGASWCKPGEPLYEESERLGAAIAKRGYKLINGGYSGTMEGTAKGAASVGGVEIEGVVVPDLFRARSPKGNEYLTTAVPTATLLDRIQHMVTHSNYFIIMNGTLGTLTEAAIIWNLSLLAPLAGKDRPTIVLYRHPWQALMKSVGEALKLGPEVMDCLVYVDSAEEAVETIDADWTSRVPPSRTSTGGAAAV